MVLNIILSISNEINNQTMVKGPKIISGMMLKMKVYKYCKYRWTIWKCSTDSTRRSTTSVLLQGKNDNSWIKKEVIQIFLMLSKVDIYVLYC